MDSARIITVNIVQTSPPLPIDAALPELTAALRASNTAVLVAPPGAGKTTRVPLVLAEEAWAEQRRRISRRSEPRPAGRRARAAAERMAKTLGEKRRRHGRPARALRLESVGAHADRDRHRGRVHAARSRRSRCSKASPPSCSTNSMSARSMPISASRWRATCSRACARICGSSSCRRRSTARAWRSSWAMRR